MLLALSRGPVTVWWLLCPLLWAQGSPATTPVKQERLGKGESLHGSWQGPWGCVGGWGGVGWGAVSDSVQCLQGQRDEQPSHLLPSAV